MNKKINEIRRLLGRKYHLSVECGIDVECGANERIEITKWALFKNYENADPIYWSNDNKAIMKSETHSLEDLYKFAKSHKRYDVEKCVSKMNIIIFGILFVVSIANVFINSVVIRTIILTSDVLLLLWLAVVSYISDKNWKVDRLEMQENWQKRYEEIFKWRRR